MNKRQISYKIKDSVIVNIITFDGTPKNNIFKVTASSKTALNAANSNSEELGKVINYLDYAGKVICYLPRRVVDQELNNVLQAVLRHKASSEFLVVKNVDSRIKHTPLAAEQCFILSKTVFNELKSRLSTWVFERDEEFIENLVDTIHEKLVMIKLAIADFKVTLLHELDINTLKTIIDTISITLNKLFSNIEEIYKNFYVLKSLNFELDAYYQEYKALLDEFNKLLDSTEFSDKVNNALKVAYDSTRDSNAVRELSMIALLQYLKSLYPVFNSFEVNKHNLTVKLTEGCYLELTDSGPKLRGNVLEVIDIAHESNTQTNNFSTIDVEM